MRAIFAVTGLGLLGLAACAPRPAVAPAAPAAPLPVAGQDWHFHLDGDSAMLAYRDPAGVGRRHGPLARDL
jgi:hypothetical protein